MVSGELQSVGLEQLHVKDTTKHIRISSNENFLLKGDEFNSTSANKTSFIHCVTNLTWQKTNCQKGRKSKRQFHLIFNWFIKCYFKFYNSDKRLSFWRFVLISLLIQVILQMQLVNGQMSRGITGKKTPCTNEGEIVDTGFSIACLQCICLNGTVICNDLKCSAPKQCYALMKYKDDKCCPKCQVCKYREQIRQSSNEWTYQKDDTCRATTCKDGVITISREQCYNECSDPSPPILGECCPSCPGCKLAGRKYKEGAVFKSPHDRCVMCVCQNNSITCKKKSCPVLACPIERSKKVGCCRQCEGQHQRFQLQNGNCWKERGILENGESYKPDKCTKCTCVDGTPICNRKTCPIVLPCEKSEQILQKNSCCAICKNQVPKNCVDDKLNKRLHGSTWQDGKTPCDQCQCSNGTIKCRTLICDESAKDSCKEGEVYDIVPGSCCKQCIEAPGICSVFGDPHYRTFDNRPFNFQGDCKYVLAKDCADMNFTVIVKNDAKRSRTFSWTKSVELKIMPLGSMGTTMINLESHLVPKVNGSRVALPYSTPTIAMQIYRHVLQVRTSVGVSLNWDGDSFLEVGASVKYQNKLCGLCGNFNGFKRDDFMGGDQTFKYEEVTFGNSWKVEDGLPCSRDNLDATSTDPCNKSLPLKIMARKKCQIFKSESFRPCHSVVDPTEYYRSCLTDTCECPLHRKCSCESLMAYSAACYRSGVKIEWDRPLYCRKPCSKGKVYSECGPRCRMSCKNYARLKEKGCRKQCVAGCHCPAGTLLHRRKCVRIQQCPNYRSLLELSRSSIDHKLPNIIEQSRRRVIPRSTL